MSSEKKSIVVSGINFFEGGPLTVMTEALETLSKYYSDRYKIIALVSSKKLYQLSNIEYLEFPKSRVSWFFRLYYEYIYFLKLSKKLKPDYWLSMHDITPNVICQNRFVYCHNPAPFFKPTLVDFKYGFTTYLFSKFYKFLYAINIKKNRFVIVQQDWLREQFKQKLKVENIIVAYPEKENNSIKKTAKELTNTPKNLFYPSYPRSFKNFEIVCEAFRQLPREYQNKLHIYMTIDETLNNYSKKIVQRYKKIDGLHFIGLQLRKEVFKYYDKVDGLIFPSRLETWGLPISEFKPFNKPIFLANLPYAHETLGKYEQGKFFDPYSATELSNILKDYIDGNLQFDTTNEKKIKKPFVKEWKQLFKMILDE